MKIDKLVIEKKDDLTFLIVELDISDGKGGYKVELYNHINRKNKIDITNEFVENNNVASARVDLAGFDITNTTVLVIEVETEKFEVYKGVVTDITNYFGCLVREVVEEIDDDCENCVPGSNENLLQLSALINAFKDAATIGAIDELIQIAMIIDKLCNSNCKTCG